MPQLVVCPYCPLSYIINMEVFLSPLRYNTILDRGSNCSATVLQEKGRVSSHKATDSRAQAQCDQVRMRRRQMGLEHVLQAVAGGRQLRRCE
jgi:hypothetical protein